MFCLLWLWQFRRIATRDLYDINNITFEWTLYLRIRKPLYEAVKAIKKFVIIVICRRRCSCTTRYTGWAGSILLLYLNWQNYWCVAIIFFCSLCLLVCFGCAYNVSLITPFQHTWLTLLCDDGAFVISASSHITEHIFAIKGNESLFRIYVWITRIFFFSSPECLLFTTTGSG